MEPTASVRIGTHNGSFHADEVLAIAILTKIYPDHHIIRTRDPDTLSWMDFVIDVGGIYNHQARRYDHHMAQPPQSRNGHLYSSAGLVWRHYAYKYLEAIKLPKIFLFQDMKIDMMRAVETNIRHQWIEPIDRNDNGTTQEATPISALVQTMRPTDPMKSKANYDKMFLETVAMVSYLFERACFHSADYTIAQTKHIAGDKEFLCDGKIVISQHPIPTYRSYTNTDVHFAIFPSQPCDGLDNHIVMRPIPQPGKNRSKTDIPHLLLGARDKAVEKFTGVTGIVYIHHGGFLVLAETQAAAIEFARYCLSRAGDS